MGLPLQIELLLNDGGRAFDEVALQRTIKPDRLLTRPSPFP
jgi:hypothetical protein